MGAGMAVKHAGNGVCTKEDLCDDCCCCLESPCQDADHCDASCEENEACDGVDCDLHECPECDLPSCGSKDSLSACSSAIATPAEEELHCHWGDACSFAFTSPSDLDLHLKSSHISFLKHQTAQHQLQLQLEQLRQQEMRFQEAQNELISCQWDACDVTVEEFDSLLNHVKSDHISAIEPVRSLQCHWHECQEEPIDPQVIDNHILSHMSSVVQPLQCEWDTCGFNALSSNMLVSHVLQDHVPGQTHSHAHPHAPHKHAHHRCHSEHKCLWVTGDTVCGRVFASALDLTEHAIACHVGSRAKAYPCCWSGCERSSKPFQQRQKIIRHLQVHTHNRPFECAACGRRFPDKAVLAQHMRVHSGERPYCCTLCGKRFAASTALSVHTRTHTGEKPLKCKWPGCTKSFSESSNLAKHMRIHRGDLRFKCEHCEKEFVRHDQLIRHSRVHVR